MPDSQPTHDTDVPNGTGNDGGDGGGSPNPTDKAADPSTEAVLKEINAATGRNFTNIDDARKHLVSLNSFVGNPRLREDADKMEKLVKKIASERGIPVEEARKEIEDALQDRPAPSSQSAPADKTSPEVAARLDRLERKEFLQEHPDAAEYIDRVAKYAKANNMDLQAAYSELYEPVFAKQKQEKQDEALRKEKIGASVSASGSMPEAPAGSQEAKALENYRKTGKRQFFTEAIKLRDERNRRAANSA